MSDRNRKIVRVVIFIVVVLGICFGGIVAVDLLMPKEKVEDAPTPSSNPSPIPTEGPLPSEEPVEEKEVSMELAEKLYGLLYDGMYCGSGFGSNLKYDKITPDMFSNEFKNTIIAGVMFDRDYGTRKQLIYSKQEILEVKDSFFGSDISFEIVDKTGCGEFKKLEDGRYKINAECGEECVLLDATKIIKSVQRENMIYIDQKIVFKSMTINGYDEGGFIYYYKDANYEILLGQDKYVDYDDYAEKRSNFDWEYYGSRASIYRYTYQDNEDGTYTFIQIEKIN